ncbi:MAG: porin family protein [Acidobacteriia bacterium]|nr:porin family protein [Terriglobia bacterium]
MKRTLRIAILLTFACASLAAFSNLAQAQKIDVAFGISTVDAPGASTADSNHSPVSLTGGTYPGFSGDVLFWHNLGIGGEVYWKATQSDNYLGSGFNYRPLFYDINAVYAPKIASHTYLELVGGIGALSTRFYTGTVCGPFSCTNYQSSNHFDADFGAGIKFYPSGGFFIRPEARVYLVNNNIDFSSPHATRYGLSIGYTFGGH